jgi:two-component system response regulator PhcR
MIRSEDDAMTILYVDDEDIACKYFARAIGPGYHVITANSVDTAIAILAAASDNIAIMVTDYRMPGRNGGDLLRQVEQQFPHIIRILVTAFADSKMLLDTVNSGALFRIIEKPFDIDNIRHVLRQAQQLAQERITRQQRLMAIDETLAFLAHELTTPLAAIVNFSRGIQRRLGDGIAAGEQRAEIGTAALATQDCARYCLSLLSAFGESVQKTPSAHAIAEQTSAHTMILSLLDMYPIAAAQRAAVRVEIEQDFPITALRNCVSLVLSSILGNALRALQNHRAPFLCFTVAVGERAQIRIRDNGPGIAPEILQRLLQDPVTTHGDGNGWGMIFCKRIMQSFGGDIEVQSSPGQGTTVILNFPTFKATNREE